MDIQFFYVTEHVQNKTLSVQHCPTEEMVADFFTKPLEGSLFVKLWNFIMGTEYADPDQQKDDGSRHSVADSEAESTMEPAGSPVGEEISADERKRKQHKYIVGVRNTR